MKLPVFSDPVTGEPSLSVTITALTFATVLGRWMLGGINVFGHTFGVVSTDEITTWLTPVFLLYFGRAGTKAVENVALVKATGGQP